MSKKKKKNTAVRAAETVETVETPVTEAAAGEEMVSPAAEAVQTVETAETENPTVHHPNAVAARDASVAAGKASVAAGKAVWELVLNLLMAVGYAVRGIGRWIVKGAVALGRWIAKVCAAFWRRFSALVVKHWPLILRPITVLMCICLVVSGVLAVTNYYTAPVIAEAERQRAVAARRALLPADEFVQVEGSWSGVTEAWQALAGGESAGYVITGAARGFGGDVPVMVAIDPQGVILGVQIQNTEETQGYGSRVEEPAFKDQFGGLAAAPLTLNEDVEQVAGATVSSRAAVNAVNAAVAAYTEIVEGE